jgi:uncharacterized protein (TIGR02246 family)
VQNLAAETSQPESSIVKAAEAYLKAVLAGNAAAVAATYREDAVEMPPFREPLKGRRAIEQYYRELFRGQVKITEFTFSHLEVKAAGSVGYTAGTYKQKLSGAPGGPIEDAGNFVVIVKRGGGAWKAAYVIYNSDRPPETQCAPAAALPFPRPDLTALIRYSAGVAYRRLLRLGLASLGAAAVLVLLLVRVVHSRAGGLRDPGFERL